MQDDITLKALMEACFKDQVENEEWDVVDNTDPLKRKTLSPMLCDNRAKIVKAAQLLLSVALSEFPQHRDIELAKCVKSLLGFSQAHNINLPKLIQKEIEQED